MIHALSYAYAHRKAKKSDMRRLWNIRIGAAARENGISYSQFIHGLKLSSIDIDRKMLSELAILDSKVFSQLVIKAKEQLPVAS
ncbi:MAG: large subunit ribosomal protein L20 [Chloroflexi bacterium]|nr:MAG: large subunit ribosomal protein L20 [Chloroflexota bacterium]